MEVSVNNSEPNLFSPITIRGVTLRNRIAVPPMCQYSAPDSLANDWHMVHYGARAVGGAGLIIAEATAVAPEGRISPHDLGLWDDRQIGPLERITRFLHEMGAVAAVQLGHAGRKASTKPPAQGEGVCRPEEGGWTPVAPSALPYHEGEPIPQALDEAGIQGVVRAFAAAGRRAIQAGFKAIEVHAAHGYLLHEFLSPLSNRRTDRYGGSLENRMRLVLEVAEALRRAMPEEAPLIVRISATDWVEGGWDLEQSISLARELQTRGVDFIDTSSGGAVPGAKVPVGPGYQAPFAAAIRKQTGILTGAVGLITTPQQANEIITSGAADLVLLGRVILGDPSWPIKARIALGLDPGWPIQYERAR
jgi:2,4-dienoyl-CoA reductase-like NADH-dependent reductase (Old Yellow Enzyme family)